MRPYVAELARLADCYISCHPNAGLPNAFGEYDEQPAETAAALAEFAHAGLLNIVGGCCGTTPEHIEAVAALMAGGPRRRVPERARGGRGGQIVADASCVDGGSEDAALVAGAGAVPGSGCGFRG